MEMEGIWIIAGMSFIGGIMAAFVFAGVVFRIMREVLKSPVVAALPGAIAGFRATGGGSRHD